LFNGNFYRYFDVVNKDPDMSGLVLGNLRIAEDRVLSYASVLKARVVCPPLLSIPAPSLLSLLSHSFL
jgi:hypothetical protein